ncbi:putative ribonuclease H-like domain-containing protein [Tanacetum coccineum]
MDVKSSILYGKIDEEVYVSQLPGFIDPKYPKKIYKVVKALYGLHQAPRAWYATLSTFLLKNGYRRGTINKTFFIKKDKNDIMLCKDCCTPIETQKPLVKDEEASDVDVHLYRSMIGSLMYLTASRPDIMFAVCACSRFRVTPKTSHLNAVKRIFRYLKGKPKLGLWYPRVFLFDLKAYSDSDYTRANLDRKSTTREAEYVAAANCCGQVLWIQNQMYITAKVAGKHVSISEASIRSDLLFNDADGIDSLPNQAIFDGYSSIGEGSGGNHKGQSSSDRSLCRENEGWHGHSNLCGKKIAQIENLQSIKIQLSMELDDDAVDSYGRLRMLLMMWEDKICRPDEGIVDQNEGRSATQTAPTTTTPTIFGDDETIAQIDPKDKGKKKIEEEDKSDTESEGITEAEKKFKRLARDEEVARKVQEDWEAEEEVKKLVVEEATKAALSNEYDFIQARLNANKILTEKLQEEEREMYTIEQRSKLLHDTIAAQRRFLAQQRSEAIRNKPPSRNQLRNQMMTYLNHVGGKKHSDLKTKSFEEIQICMTEDKKVF